MISTDTVKIPEFFSTVKIPAVARWASDKTRSIKPHDLEVEGRTVEVRDFFFEGKFPRKVDEFFAQWDAPETGRQFTLAVRCRGGAYRGEKPTVGVYFTEYVAKDGKPLPTE